MNFIILLFICTANIVFAQEPPSEINKRSELEELQLKIDILKKKKELMELEKSLEAESNNSPPTTHTVNPEVIIAEKERSDVSLIVGGDVSILSSLDEYNNDLKEFLEISSNQLLDGGSNSQVVREHVTGFNFHLGLAKSYQLSSGKSFEWQFIYSYFSTKEVESSSTDRTEDKWLYRLNSKFSSHSLRTRGYYNFTKTENFEFGIGGGLGLSRTTLKESYNLNTSDYSWPDVLEEYDLKELRYNGTSFTAELLARVKYNYSESVSFSFNTGYRFMKVGDMDADEENFDYEKGEKRENVNGDALEVDLSGIFFGIELGVLVF